MDLTLKQIVVDNTAKFSHVIAGVLYYVVDVPYEISDGTIGGYNTYQFSVDMNDRDDVGTTTFMAEYKAITLMRYIRKALSSDNFIKVR